MRIRDTLVIALLMGFVALSARAAEVDEDGHTTDSLATVQQNLADEDAVLVDVREQGEWKKGHLDGALFLPLSRLAKQHDAATLAKQLDKKKIVYAHCASGHRCKLAADILRDAGYDVRPLKQGYQQLVKEGFAPAE
ncbi:MAG: rhodanese-like domain-containing protein [Pirellulales bacterium]